MHRRLYLWGVGALVVAALAGWHTLGVAAASGPHGKTNEKDARAQENLPIQPTEDAQQLRQQVETGVTKATNNGYYACCIRPACSWCMLHIGKCTCVLGVGTGRWACRECHGGWEAGQGYIPGRSREDVRKMKTLTVAEQRHTPESTEHAPTEAIPALPRTTSPEIGTQIVAAGEKLFGKLNCQSCHKMQGTGGAVGPDLTHEAQRHADIAWQIAHLQHPDKVHPGSRMPSFANLKPEELRTLAAYLVAPK